MHQPIDEQWRFDRDACPYCGCKSKLFRRPKDGRAYCDACGGLWWQFETDRMKTVPDEGE